jgi:hypothetical protein
MGVSKEITDALPVALLRPFSSAGSRGFLIDSMNSPVGPAWPDFVEAINGGSIFSIITARGHNPETLKKAVRIYIDNDFNGISKKRVMHNLKKYRDLTEFKSEGDIIDDYLDLCKFYPVSFGSGSAANPEDEKVKALNEFYDYCKSMAKKLKKAFSFKNDIKGEALKNLKFSIGFSDDDPKNIETIKNKVNKPELTIYSTNKGTKEKV